MSIFRCQRCGLGRSWVAIGRLRRRLLLFQAPCCFFFWRCACGCCEIDLFGAWSLGLATAWVAVVVTGGLSGRVARGCDELRGVLRRAVHWAGIVGGCVRVCGIWRVVVAKTPLNSGKLTIFGGLRVQFGPLGMTDGDDTGTVFSFPRVTRLPWFSLRNGIGWESPEWALQPPIIVDLPESDPVFSTSRVEIRLSWLFWSGVVSHLSAAACFAGSTETRSGALRRIWALRPAGGVWRIGCCGFDQGAYSILCVAVCLRSSRYLGRRDVPVSCAILIKPGDTLSFDSKGGGKESGSNLAD